MKFVSRKISGGAAILFSVSGKSPEVQSKKSILNVKKCKGNNC